MFLLRPLFLCQKVLGTQELGTDIANRYAPATSNHLVKVIDKNQVLQIKCSAYLNRDQQI